MKLAPDWAQTRTIFRNKLNRVWTNQFTTELLDTDPKLILYKLLSCFQQFDFHSAGHQLNIGSEPYRAILEDPVIRALLDEGVLFNHTFESSVRFPSIVDFFHAADFVDEEIKKMSFFEKMKYKNWRFRQGYFFFRIERQKLRRVRTADILEPKMGVDLELSVHTQFNSFKEAVEWLDDDGYRTARKPFYSFWVPGIMERSRKEK